MTTRDTAFGGVEATAAQVPAATAAYVAPAARVLTVLHRQDPRTWPADEPPTRTVCGEPMLAEELWQPVEQRSEDAVCVRCAEPGKARAEDIQEALL